MMRRAVNGCILQDAITGRDIMDRARYHWRSIRLKGYDYTQPVAYFVTVVTQDRVCLFGEIVDGRMRLNRPGKIVYEEWFRTARLRPYVELRPDEFIVMPNHIHGIIRIVDIIDDDNVVGARRRRAPTSGTTLEQFGRPVPGSIPTIIRAFKSATTRRINEGRGTLGPASGSAITGNISSEMKRPWNVFVDTF
nr:transposase [Rhodothermus marinus]